MYCTKPAVGCRCRVITGGRRRWFRPRNYVCTLYVSEVNLFRTVRQVSEYQHSRSATPSHSIRRGSGCAITGGSGPIDQGASSTVTGPRNHVRSAGSFDHQCWDQTPSLPRVLCQRPLLPSMLVGLSALASARRLWRLHAPVRFQLGLLPVGSENSSGQVMRRDIR